MKPNSENAKPNSGLRFTVNQLLIATSVLAIPMALLSNYWLSVNDTVDNRTIPFSDAGAMRQAYLIGGLVLIGMLAIVFTAVLLRRRLFFGAALFALSLLILVFPISRLFQSKIISPVRGNEIAEIHNDAAAIVATAVDRYYSRTQAWPRNWNDLDADIERVIDDIEQNKTKSTADPFATGGDPFSGNHSENEESQSIFSRAPDIGNITAQDIRNLVDLDFAANPKKLAKMNWVEFTGIVPHKPSYNTYRVEFSKLIDCLSQGLDPSVVSQSTAK